jgi:hypothetical protein
MEVKGGSTADHATVDPFTSNGGNHQCWTFRGIMEPI